MIVNFPFKMLRKQLLLEMAHIIFPEGRPNTYKIVGKTEEEKVFEDIGKPITENISAGDPHLYQYEQND
ncbi:MAG TPA: hypothetical protein VI033_02410 [Candidatus Nitrosopolaris sp.]